MQVMLFMICKRVNFQRYFPSIFGTEKVAREVEDAPLAVKLYFSQK